MKLVRSVPTATRSSAVDCFARNSVRGAKITTNMLWPRITVLAIVLRINTPKARHEVAASLSTIIHLRRAGFSPFWSSQNGILKRPSNRSKFPARSET